MADEMDEDAPEKPDDDPLAVETVPDKKKVD
jgi:hypothetical protein